MRRGVVGVVGVAVVAVMGWLYVGDLGDKPKRSGAERNGETSGGVVRGVDASVSFGAKAKRSTRTSSEGRRPRRRSQKVGVRKDEEGARSLRSRLARQFAQARRTPESAEGGDRASLPREYIQAAISDIAPLLQECISLAKVDSDDEINGRLMISFEISGDPELGGVIGASEIVEGSTIERPSLRECVRETMYALVLDAPEGEGEVTVRYPFVFFESSDAKSSE